MKILMKILKILKIPKNSKLFNSCPKSFNKKTHPTQTLIWIAVQQQGDDVHGLLGQKQWKDDTLIANVPQQLVLVGTGEWRLADQHLVEQHTEAPPVHRVVVFDAL